MDQNTDVIKGLIIVFFHCRKNSVKAEVSE